ncbi:glycosyltransferase [Winogradskyella ursingii]|uniref:glycosyltransferase n=1 Tax=Winogradskyella ursingii TaxID=2686079 RepID=UPI0015CB7EC4|nr:glycosyltransferase [Winogradskyella ursingii]
MSNKIKVFFVIPTLFAGGAERVMSFVSQNLDKEKFDVTLVVIGFEKDSRYAISGITVRYLNKDRVLHSVFTLAKIFRKQKPQIVISAISHLNVVMGFMSVFFPKIKFIGRHTIVRIQDKEFKAKYKKNTFKKRIKQPLGKGYKLLDIILCQSMDMFVDMRDESHIPEHKLRIINNPITDNFDIKLRDSNNGEITKLITVARISKNKGHKRILNALSKVDFPYQYTIIGKGVEKDNVFDQIKKLGIEGRIKYIPFTTEVPKHLASSDFYLMGSYSEGLPNSLIESCSVGTPVLAYRAPGGLNEVIEPGINGYLVDSEEEFIEKLNESVKKEWSPEIIRNSVYKKFNKKKIISDYEHLFFDVLNK